MADVSLIEFFYNYPSSFLIWLYSLIWWDIFLITAFTVAVDISRSIGKVAVLAIDAAKKRVRPVQYGSPTTKISVLVPAHNESQAIKRTVMSILENSYPYKEVIVVDDHSTDDTYQQMLPFHERGLIKLVRRMGGTKGTKAAAVNYAAVFATGDFLLVMDGDTLIERSALRESAKYLTMPDVIGVSGNVRIMGGDGGVVNTLSRLQSYEYLIAFELGRRYNALLGILLIVPGGFGLLKKDLAKSVGLYDMDSIGEDFELSVRLLKTGGRLEFAPGAIAWTYCPNNWKAWLRQRIRWHHGQLSTILKHRDLLRKYTFRSTVVTSFYDMIIMDIVFLLMRAGAIVMLALSFTETLLYVYTLLYALYFVNEFIIIAAAALFSPDKKDLKYIYLVPVVIAFYRPFYSCIRFYAYMKRLLGKGVNW